MKIPLGGGSAIRIELNGMMWAGIAVGGVGVAAAAARYFGVIPKDERFENVPLGVTILGAALYTVGRVVQMVRQIRSRR